MAKILIVEDNQGTNKAICEYMKEAGHTLFSAFTGSEALKIFREKELDIIVLDIMLPEMSGIVVLHEISKISNIRPVIFIAFFIRMLLINSDLSSNLCPLNKLYHTQHKESRNISAERQVII